MKKLILLLLLLLPINSFAQLYWRPTPRMMEPSYLDSLRKALPNAREDTAKVWLLLQVEVFSSLKNQDPKGQEYIEQALALSEKLEFLPGIAASKMALTNYYIGKDIKSRVKAIIIYMEAVSIYEKMGSKFGMANANLGIGMAYHRTGNPVKAMEYMLKAVTIFEELKDKVNLPLAYTQIGALYGELRDSAKSANYYNKAIISSTATHDELLLAGVYGEYANHFWRKQQYNQAEDYIERATALYNKNGMPYTETRLGPLYSNQRRYAKAHKKLTTDLANNQQNAGTLSWLQAAMGELYYRLVAEPNDEPLPDSLHNKAANLRRAEQYLNTAIEAFRQRKNFSDWQQGLYTLAKVYTLQGRHEDAAKTFEEYSGLKDSISVADIRLKMGGLELERDLAVFDKQIELDKLAVAKKRNERIFFIAGIIVLIGVLAMLFRSNKKQQTTNRMLTTEKKRSDNLLLNILPAEVAEELKDHGSIAARQYDEVTVLFTDFVNFTGSSERLGAQTMVRELNECFTAFDVIIERNSLEKIKTIGDAYLAVCGLPITDPQHAKKTIQAALEIRDFIEERKRRKAFLK